MATSRLQQDISRLLSIHLGGFTVRENHRPEWLATGNGGWLELDFFIEELHVAIEVQGIQHYVYRPFFHKDYNAYIDQLHRDRDKREKCEQRGVKLYEVVAYEEALDLVYKLSDKEHKYPVHPNYTAHYAKPGKLFTEYPATIRKHLKRLKKRVNKILNRGCVEEKDLQRMDISLQAIQQYQQAVGQRFRLDRAAQMVIRDATSMIEVGT